VSDLKAPGWSRAAQIGLGALAIILSIVILAFPGTAIVSIALIIGILLLIVGIESVISGIFVKSRSRMVSIGLGIIVIIFGNHSNGISGRNNRISDNTYGNRTLDRWYL
jgi:uncharacterized membrane protein HdeD (DUF308 family)